MSDYEDDQSAVEDQSVSAESVHVDIPAVTQLHAGDKEMDLLQSISQSLHASVSMRGGLALSRNKTQVAETRRSR